MKLKLAVMLLVLCVLVPSAMSRRRRGGSRRRGGRYNRYSRCNWCFGSANCFGGASSENINSNCTNCIANKCNANLNIIVSTSTWLDCFKNAWQGPCNTTCPQWSSTYDNRKQTCISCLNSCRRTTARVLSTRCQRSGDPCSSCYGGNDCYTKEQVGQLFGRFCLDYIRISCQSQNFSNECVLRAIQDSCSQCNSNTTVNDRLNNCVGCLNACKAESNCRQTCQNNYPTTVSCPYCSNFVCRNRWNRASCESSKTAACGSTCDVCNTCKVNCNATSVQNFNFSGNTCACFETKPSTPLSLFDIFYGSRYFGHRHRFGSRRW